MSCFNGLFMNIKEIAAELEKNTGATISVDSDNRFSLLLDKEYTITFEEIEEKNSLYLYSILGNFDLDNSKILSKLLEANLFGLQTANATFSIEPNEQLLILHRHLNSKNIEYREFEAAFLQFFSTVKEWKEKLQTLLQATTSAQEISSIRKSMLTAATKKNVIIFM